MDACIRVLAPFYQATVEMSAEKNISGSKVIPMTKMLTHNLYDVIATTSHNTAKTLGENLLKVMQSKFSNLESQTQANLATLLDPRFKALGFISHNQAQSAVTRLTGECAAEMRAAPPEERPPASAQPAPAATGNNSIINRSNVDKRTSRTILEIENFQD